MNEIFDATFRAMMAWQQIGLLLGGLVLLAIAGFLLAWLIHLRLTGRRVRARLVAVRMTERREGRSAGRWSGEMYYPVFEYPADGEVRRAEGNGGSNWLLNKLPGTEVDAYVRPDDPETVHRPGLMTLIVALLLGAGGIGLLGWALTTYEVSRFTILIGLVLAGWAALKIAWRMKPPSQWETRASFRQRQADRRRQKRAEGRLLSSDEIRERVATAARQQRRWAPALVLVGIALIGLGAWLARDMHSFLAGAERASGRVSRLDSHRRTSSDGSTDVHYPVVAFSTSRGDRVEFRGRVGSSPPAYRPGDRVTVLYDPADPQSAIIDQGLWNWMVAGGCLLMGLLLPWAAWRLRRAVRRATKF